MRQVLLFLCLTGTFFVAVLNAVRTAHVGRGPCAACGASSFSMRSLRAEHITAPKLTMERLALYYESSEEPYVHLLRRLYLIERAVGYSRIPDQMQRSKCWTH